MIGKYIRDLRRAKGYTSEDLAEVLNVTRQQAENYERDLNRIDIPDFFAICNWLKKSPNYFYKCHKATLKEKE